VRGLNDGETLQWCENAGVMFILLMRNSCVPLLLVVVTAGALGGLADQYPAALLLVVAIYYPIAGIAVLLFLLYAAYFLVQTKRTSYFISSQRLLEVRGGSIKKQIPRANLQGLKPDQYLKSVWPQKGGGRETYIVYVTDSSSGVVMRMTGMRGEVAEYIERWVKESRAV